MDLRQGCVFCNLYRDRSQGAVVKEYGPYWLAFDRHPVTPGHMLIIPKRHVSFIGDLNLEESRMLVGALKSGILEFREHNLRRIYDEFRNSPVSPRAAEFAQKALDHPGLHTKPAGFNYGLNEGKAAGQTVDHLHWHIIPRYHSDMVDPRGGVRHVIPEMGNYKALRLVAAVPSDDEGMEQDIRESRDMKSPNASRG